MRALAAENESELLTAAQVAELLQTTTRYVWSLGRSGVLPRVVLPGGRLVRFDRRDVDALIAAGRRTGPEAPAKPTGRFTRKALMEQQTAMRF